MSSPHMEMFANSKEFTIRGGEFSAVGRDNYRHIYHGGGMSNNTQVVYGPGNYDVRVIVEEILRAQRQWHQARTEWRISEDLDAEGQETPEESSDNTRKARAVETPRKAKDVKIEKTQESCCSISMMFSFEIRQFSFFRTSAPQ